MSSVLLISEHTNDALNSATAKAYLELASHFLKVNILRSYFYAKKAHQLSIESLESGRYQRREDSVIFLSISAAALNRMGVYANRRSDAPQALEWLLESARISESIRDSTHLSSALYNIAYLYFQLRETDKTFDYMNQSLEIRKAMKDTALIASSLQAMGSIHSRIGEYAEAQEKFERAIDYANQTGFIRITSTCYYSIGTNYAKQGKFEEAL